MRQRLLQILARQFIKHGKITTTLAKARAVQPLVEKLITRAKKGSGADRFAGRTSGFTRIVRLGSRTGDATEMAILSLVDAPVYGKQNKTNQSK